jgi:hypothetical protein
MAWIESHQSLGGHIKLRRLARMLGVERAQAVGHLHYLWWWALDGAPSGDLTGFTPEEIAELSDWPGDADLFAEALHKCGWLDSDNKIHDWNDYAGKLIERRTSERERLKAHRNAVRTANVHSTNGVRTVLPYPTVPYHTVPNTHTQCECVDNSVQKLDTEVPRTAEIPTLEEVKTYGDIHGCKPEMCADFWTHYESNNLWLNQHGRMINWKLKLMHWRDNPQKKPGKHSSAWEIDQKLKALTEQLKTAKERDFTDEGKTEVKRIESEIRTCKTKLAEIPI